VFEVSELKRFTADQARTLMDSSRTPYLDRYMSALYKQIELRAKNGFNYHIIKGTPIPSKTKTITDMLREDGYKVEYNCGENEFVIKW
jgi:uncharacterized protein (UPF0305 family)